MGLDPGRTGRLSPAEARAEAERRRRERKRPPVVGESAADKARPPVVSTRPVETQRRYDDVVRGAQRTIAQRYADDPVTGRIPPKPDGTRHRERADSLTRQVLGYGLAGGAAIPSPASVPLSALSAIILSADPSTRDQFKGAKDQLDAARESGDKTEGLRAALDFSLITGAAGSGPTRGFTPLPRAGEAARPAGADDIIAALPKAKQLRREQEKLYTGERQARVARAAEAMKVGGEEGYQAALAELKGELPKLKFGALEDFNQESMEALLKHVQDHDGLKFFEKVTTQKALKLVVEEGRVPTRNQIKLLEKAFGESTATQIVESAGWWKQAKNHGLSLINVPRSLMASYDVSAPFRQGLVLGMRHPKMFARELGPMFKALKSERAYEDVMEEIASRPTFATMQNAKLALTDLEGLTTREDQFMSNMAEGIPVAGKGVRASGRAYTAFLNKFRADAFDNYLRMADEMGLDIKDPHLLRSIASWVNHATGRGSIKYFEGSMVPLSAALFSPRLMASRLQLLNPVYYKKLHPFARKQALRGATTTLSAISLTLWMAKFGGADVELDPRSTDFGKIKVGNTRVDITGGFQGYVVAASRFVKGESKSSTTGEIRKLEGGFGNPSRWGLIASFLENKTAPVMGTAIDALKNENFAGDPFDPKDLWKQAVPFGVSGGLEGYKEGGIGAAAAAVGLGGIGFGVQTYKAKPPKAAKKAYKEQLAAIDAAVRHGEVNEEDAEEFRRSARATFEAEVREKQLAGLDEKELRRQLVIDDAVRQDMPLEELNGLIADFGWEPVTADELEETELDLLELRAVEGG